MQKTSVSFTIEEYIVDQCVHIIPDYKESGNNREEYSHQQVFVGKIKRTCHVLSDIEEK